MTEEVKFYPPAASAGGDNAFYLSGCDIVQRSPAYASCLFKMAELKAGRRPEIYRDCHEAIEARRCKAVEMRQEEELKGQAIYFFPRRPPQALTLPVSVTGEFGIRISNLTPSHLMPKGPKPSGRLNAGAARNKPQPVAPSKANTLDEELLHATANGFAAAITSAVTDNKQPEDSTATPTPMPTPAARPALLSGETPLQYARRLAASR